jgi:hypothetical protein
MLSRPRGTDIVEEFAREGKSQTRLAWGYQDWKSRFLYLLSVEV